MANTKVPAELSSTPGIIDNSSATAITIDSAGAATFSGTVTADGLTVQTTNGLNAVLESTTSYQYLQFKNSGYTENYIDFTNRDFHVLCDNVNRFTINGTTGAATFSGNLGLGTTSPVSFGANTSFFTANGTSSGNGYACQVAGTNYGLMYASTNLLTISAEGASTPIHFATNNATRMVLDISGNLTLNTANSTLNVGNGGFSQTNYGLLGLNGSNGGFIKMGTAGVEQGAVYANSGGLTFQTPATYAMTWYPAGAFGMKLDTSGNLLVGVNSVDSAIRGIEVKGSANKYVGMFRNTTDGYGIIFRSAANTSVGTIVWSASATAYNTSSDYRLKEDAVPMTGATERVKALRPINFAWKVDGSRTDGFLAHEAQEVVPEAVHGTKDAMRDEEYEVTPAVEEVRDEDGNIITEAVAAVMGTRSVPDYQGIDQSKLVPLLTATIQELIARIEALEGE